MLNKRSLVCHLYIFFSGSSCSFRAHNRTDWDRDAKILINKIRLQLRCWKYLYIYFSQYKYTLKNDHWRSLYYILLVKRKRAAAAIKIHQLQLNVLLITYFFFFFCNSLSFPLPLSTMIYLNALSNDLYDYDHIRIYRLLFLERNYYFFYFYWNLVWIEWLGTHLRFSWK